MHLATTLNQTALKLKIHWFHTLSYVNHYNCYGIINKGQKRHVSKVFKIISAFTTSGLNVVFLSWKEKYDIVYCPPDLLLEEL